jgi:FkbM family methyltransferase
MARLDIQGTKMKSVLRQASSLLPDSLRRRMRRWRYSSQIRQGTFKTDEPEFGQLEQWIRPGDTVIDVGANVGHYTVRLARIVGSTGRVIAFEPVPHTFAMLVENLESAALGHVTFVNAAATREPARLKFDVPQWEWGGLNYYQSRVSDAGTTEVVGLPVDAVLPPGKVTFVKVDVEGHELACLHGCRRLLERDHPMLMVEGDETAVRDFLAGFGYTGRRLDGSPNTLYAAAGASI